MLILLIKSAITETWNSTLKKEIEENLKNANDALIEIDATVKLVVVGGAALILSNIVNRSTTDVDFINAVSANMIILLDEFEINDRVVTFEQTYGDWKGDVINIPNKNYSNIELFTISIEGKLLRGCSQDKDLKM